MTHKDLLITIAIRIISNTAQMLPSNEIRGYVICAGEINCFGYKDNPLPIAHGQLEFCLEIKNNSGSWNALYKENT